MSSNIAAKLSGNILQEIFLTIHLRKLIPIKTQKWIRFGISWILVFVMQIFSAVLFMIIWNKVVSYSNIVNHLLSITHSWFCYCNDFVWVHTAAHIKGNETFFFRAHMQLKFVQIWPDNDKTVIYYNILARLVFLSSPKMHLLISCTSTPSPQQILIFPVYRNDSPPLQMEITVFQLTRDPESKSKPAGVFRRVSYFSLLKRTQDER